MSVSLVGRRRPVYLCDTSAAAAPKRPWFHPCQTLKKAVRMSEDSIRGRWALVTGASSGLGVDFARELGRRGCHTVLVARREERLHALAEELERDHQTSSAVIQLDLANPDAPAALHREIAERGLRIDVLVNNAGVGSHGDFLSGAWERDLIMLQLDIIALVHLTKLFARGMVERGYGRILQVASLAAYQPVPSYAVYGAAKSFVLNFGEALNHELRGTGVTCTVLSPGVTHTEFQRTAGHEYTHYMRRFGMQSPQVARIGIQAMLQRRSSVVAGWRNALLAWSVRLTPRRLATATADYFMRGGRK